MADPSRSPEALKIALETVQASVAKTQITLPETQVRPPEPAEALKPELDSPIQRQFAEQLVNTGFRQPVP